MTNDGTQDPVPPPVLADPVSGLVTGSRYEPEPLRVRVTEPPMPDISAVREAMASVLDENSELSLSAIGPAADFFTDSTGPGDTPAGGTPVPPAAKPVAQVPVAQVPTQAPGQAPPPPATATVGGLPRELPARGAVTRVPPQPARIPSPRAGGTARALPPAITPGEKSRRIQLPKGFMRRRFKPSAGAKGQSSSGSVTLIMALLFVMIVLGIVALVSLVNTIATVFS